MSKRTSVLLLAVILCICHGQQISANDVTAAKKNTDHQTQSSSPSSTTTKHWSTELSSVTTLPPPDKMLAAIASSLDRSQQQFRAGNALGQANQESLFDDSPLSEVNLSYRQQQANLSHALAPFDMNLNNHQPASRAFEEQRRLADELKQFQRERGWNPITAVNPWTPTVLSPQSYFNSGPIQVPQVLDRIDLGGVHGLEQSLVYNLDNRNTLDAEQNTASQLGVQASPPMLSQTVAPQPDVLASTAKQRHYITIEALSKYLGGHHHRVQPIAESRSAPSLPGSTLISQDLLKRALAIQDALPEIQLTKSTLPASSSKAKRLVAGIKSGGHNAGQKKVFSQPADYELITNDPPLIMMKSSAGAAPRQDHVADRDKPVAGDLVGSDYLGSLTSPRQLSLAFVPSNRHHSKWSTTPTDGRSSKLDFDYADHHQTAGSQPLDSHLFASSYRHQHSTMPTIYLTSALPLTAPSHKSLSRHAHDKSSLIHPILVGVIAAVVSFLILSNLFLSIPLLAMTLFQLFNGASQMMMMFPSNGGNQNMMPNGNNNQQIPSAPTNNQQPPANNGKRRRRRDLWPIIEGHHQAILKAITAPNAKLFNQ
jgi:hypothetical protein